MITPFVKMEVGGNDFVVLEDGWAGDVRGICSRTQGIGCDQLLMLSKTAPWRLQIFNADGTQALQCGNGLRAVAWLLFDRHPSSSELTLTINERPYRCRKENDGQIAVMMGQPYQEGGCVNIGNNHVIVWGQGDLDQAIQEVGPLWQDRIPGGVNVHMVEILTPTSLRIRHWERGVGPTLACGSGAVACVFAAHEGGLLMGEVVDVQFANAAATVRITPEGYELKGYARRVFKGEYYED